jgi:hypothetical protein
VLGIGIGMESRFWEADINPFYLDQWSSSNLASKILPSENKRSKRIFLARVSLLPMDLETSLNIPFDAFLRQHSRAGFLRRAQLHGNSLAD